MLLYNPGSSGRYSAKKKRATPRHHSPPTYLGSFLILHFNANTGLCRFEPTFTCKKGANAVIFLTDSDIVFRGNLHPTPMNNLATKRNCAYFHVPGGLFHPGDESQEIAFRYAVDIINKDKTILPRSKLAVQIERISPQDSFHASKRGELLLYTIPENFITAILQFNKREFLNPFTLYAMLLSTIAQIPKGGVHVYITDITSPVGNLHIAIS